jgi:predicted PurR-regulated permease PerM
MAISPTCEGAKDRSAVQLPNSNERAGFYRLASLVLVMGTLYFGKAVLVPFALAILLTFVLVPAMTWVEHRRLGRRASVLIIILCGLSLACSIGWIVERQFMEVATTWPQYHASIRAKSRDFMQWADRLDAYRAEIRETLTDESVGAHGPSSDNPLHGAELQNDTVNSPISATAENTSPISVRISPEPNSLLESAALHVQELMTPFMTALMVLVMLIFMLLNWEDLRDRSLSLISDSTIQGTRVAFNDAATRVSRFLVTQSIINVCFGGMATAGLWAIHMTVGGRAAITTAVTAGFLCGVFRFIPYVGVWIGASFPLAFTFAVYPNNSVFLVTLVMFFALEMFTAQVIEPHWLGASAGISATGIMLSTVFWTWLWGPMGLLLSTPLTVLLVVMGKHLPRFRYLFILLADRRELDLSPHSVGTT